MAAGPLRSRQHLPSISLGLAAIRSGPKPAPFVRLAIVADYLQSGKAFIALSASSFVLYTFIPTSIIFFPSGFFITTLHLFEVMSFAT